ncbi:MAG TPA: 2-oxoacid:ferredoxin oxidoreductase subunit beta [Gemmatimonadaceae bacterium]|nr:2-oxoacid:ferredoxin oxidoreductase subunit beta [Gemmatimonadaceae bacterium]
MTDTVVREHAAPLSPKEFASDQEVRWCPGCGDYAILKAMQKTLSEIGARREDTVFVSGIGCAARFPYYMSTYGFHTIHGRAPAIATGVKLANPALDVWVIGGDGDMLSIGGNHTLHAIRRNVDLQLILFNNEIYGLTKGQYSPTSRRGTRSPSTPGGSLDAPLHPGPFVLGAGARFFARAVDVQQPQLVHALTRAHAHSGAALVEVLQNCVVFNDGVFDHITARESASDAQVHVEHGRPLRFGKDGTRGLRFDPRTMRLEVVTIGANGVGEDDVLVHDQTNRVLATLLAAMEPPDFPVAMGVLYDDPAPTYDAEVEQEMQRALEAPGDVAELLNSGRTWMVIE